MASSTDWLTDRVKEYPNRICVIDSASHRQHSFRAFDSRANQIAHFCEQWVGLLPGDCIGLLSSPSDDVLQIALAADKLGLTALLLDPQVSIEALTQSINRYGPRTLFHGLPQNDLVRDLWFETDSVEQLIPLRGAVDTANFEDIVAYYPPTPPQIESDEENPWIHLAAEEIAWESMQMAPTLSDLPTERPYAVPTPLHRADGLAAALTALRAGECVVIKTDSTEIIESPGEVSSAEEDTSPSERNVPRGRSWLPREFM